MKIFSPRNYSRLIKHVVGRGKLVDSERGRTIEILNANLLLKNPRDRLITEAWRKLNFPFAIAEWLGVLTGENRVDFYTQFISTYGEYSSDGLTVDGSYGERNFTPDKTGYDTSQIEKILSILTMDPDSRRAVMAIYDWRDLFGGGKKNTPCTLTLQFLIRDNKLHMVANMRSNDLIWGLSNDLVVFTMLQEYVARQLDIELGNYYHNAGSFHIYEKHFSLAYGKKEQRWTLLMNKMPKINHIELLSLLGAYRNASIPDERDFEAFSLGLEQPYLHDLVSAARAFTMRKVDPTQSARWYKYINDYTIRRVMRPWLQK